MGLCIEKPLRRAQSWWLMWWHITRALQCLSLIHISKGEPVYDIDNDYIRYRYYDLLPAFNRNAYRINNEQELREIGEEEDPADDQKLYHRQGEAWIMENTWITGEKYPNDPFGEEMTVGQVDMLKRVIPGTYILEAVSYTHLEYRYL